MKRILLVIFFVMLGSSLVMSGVNFKNNGNGTVTDYETKLIWTRCSMGAGGVMDNTVNCTGSHGKYNFQSAITACESLIYAGRSDWRLPNLMELQSILNMSKTSPPVVNETYFPNTVQLNYWSSTFFKRYYGNSPVSYNYETAWFVSFLNSRISADGIVSEHYVRCVAGP